MPFLQEVKDGLKDYLTQGLEAVLQKRSLDGDYTSQIALEKPAHAQHGDFASNIAMLLSRPLQAAPRSIAQELVENLPTEGTMAQMVDRVEVAGPGFINIYMAPGWLVPLLQTIELAGDRYGSNRKGEGKKVQVEFVSANPTGPLHVGHSRGAIVGDTLSRILGFSGYAVEREFYINNAGHQIELLGRSIYLRLREEKGEEIVFPQDYYQGDYIRDLARQILAKYGDSLDIHSQEEREALCREFGYQKLLKNIKEDLKAYDIHFDRWFSERELHEEGHVEEALQLLRKKKFLYEKEGATWFLSSRFGDHKDRVVIKSDGQYTYFAADIAYHYNKLKRGFSWIIDILGADHHGYIERMKAAVEAFGYPRDILEIPIIQIVTLYRGETRVSMSKRAGEFVTMQEVLEEVGRDAARYFYLTRSPESQMDFDLEAAREQSTNNPVYYLQYAHARICSLFEKVAEHEYRIPRPREVDCTPLAHDLEKKLLAVLARFPEVVEECRDNLAPHLLTSYGHELAQAFHTFYNQCPILTAHENLREARLALVWSTRQVLRNLFRLLAISAPERM